MTASGQRWSIANLCVMSALGQKQTSAHVRVMSALPPKADIRKSPRYVCRSSSAPSPLFIHAQSRLRDAVQNVTHVTDAPNWFWQTIHRGSRTASSMRYELSNEYAPRTPLCASCAQIMRVARITSRFGGLPDLYTFECRACGVSHIEAAHMAAA